VDIFDLIVGEVALVDAVQTLDVGVTLGLERGPVKRSSLLDIEAVGFGVMDGLGDGGGIEGNLLGDAATTPSAKAKTKRSN